MKKYIIIALALFLGFASCEKAPYEEFVNTSSADEITRIQLFANSKELTANGFNEITFKVRAFGEVEELTTVEDDNGNLKDTVITRQFRFREGRLPEDAITIYTENGDVVTDNTFSTMATSDSLGFYAKGGNFTTDLFKVKLVQPTPHNFTPITIPIVFHLVASDDNMEILSAYQSSLFQEQVDKLNKVFAADFFKGPTNINLNVTFDLATQDPSGELLDEMGITRHNLGASEYDENVAYVQDNLMWDPTKYLNVWITRWDQWGSEEFDANPPTYIIGDPSRLPGINLTAVADASQAVISQPQDVGIFISPNEVNTEDFSFLYKIGEFFGLLTTEYDGFDFNGDVDFCSDTYTYRYIFPLVEKRTEPLPAGSPVYLYDSYNIMDRYSAAKAISYQQGLRIRTAMENCPFRMMRK